MHPTRSMIGAVGLPSAPYCPREVKVTMPLPRPTHWQHDSSRQFANAALGRVDKPVLAPARSERLGRRDTHVATAVTS